MFLDFGDESQYENQVRHAIALECIFYQKDCFYYEVSKNYNPVNRMGTENYKTSDFDHQLEDMTFDQKPDYGQLKPRQDNAYDFTLDDGEGRETAGYGPHNITYKSQTASEANLFGEQSIIP